MLAQMNGPMGCGHPQWGFFCLPLIFFSVAIAVVLGWVLPITLGVHQARKKNYPALWMLFGIHPLGGWIAFIVLACLPPRIQCPACGGFVQVHFRICPFCHANLAGPGPAPAPGPTPGPGPQGPPPPPR